MIGDKQRFSNIEETEEYCVPSGTSALVSCLGSNVGVHLKSCKST